MTDSEKPILFLIRRPPLLSDLSSAAMDILLTAAAFDQKIVLVFSGNGVLQLLRNQHKGIDGLKNISQALPALELYDVDQVMADADSLAGMGLTQDDLVMPVETISGGDLVRLIDESGLVFNF